MPTISAALIVKNEEVLLSRCLESLKGLDEIVICDTGSSDKTVEIAKKYTDKVHTDFVWNDDFSKARNHAKSKATGDWILSIDADEYLEDVGAVKEAVTLAEARGLLAVDIYLIGENGSQSFYYPRLFKNVEQVFWEGAVHNTVSVLGEKVGNVRVRVGSSPAHANDPNRAFRILQNEFIKSQLKNEPPSPRIMYYLGSEYSHRGDWDNTVLMMGKYVTSNTRHLAEKADAFLTMSMAFFAMGQGEDARDSCLQAININPNFKEAVLFMAKLAGDGRGNERWQKNADQWKHLAETADNSDVLFVRK
jgi:glycosyltransferase involved in cell wall biosynthesis